MAAAQVLITLWAATLAVAAPQGGVQRAVQSQDQVVSQVIVALQPSVSRAVADALASISQANSRATARARADTAERAAFEAELARDNIVAEPTARPVYNFEYKVADDKAQTYISQEEARDGDNLSGTYSYVDADGGLVTVNYEAGPMGYTEAREVQDGFVQIRAKPIKSTLDVDADAVAVARVQAARAEAARQAAARREAARAEAARLEAARLEAARRESASVNTNTLVTQVLATLQPLISQTVQEVVSSSSSDTSSSSSSLSSSNIGSSSGSISSGDVSSNFGTGGLSVSVETPDFQFAF